MKIIHLTLVQLTLILYTVPLDTSFDVHRLEGFTISSTLNTSIKCNDSITTCIKNCVDQERCSAIVFERTDNQCLPPRQVLYSRIRIKTEENATLMLKGVSLQGI